MAADSMRPRGIDDMKVMEAMRRVPRHAFVPPEYAREAYANLPLPIGFGQTISQPYVVALMSQELHLKPADRVLEVGTGSGYQAAVLAEMGMQVFTVEIIAELAEQATQRLKSLGYTGVEVNVADGYHGWPERAPFDAIVVTAAPDHVPPPLVKQLKAGGRLVIPIGPVGEAQTLWRFVADASGELTARNLGMVMFVPLTGVAAHGQAAHHAIIE
jgi:protein-L-isoaspartate(D-aspartate) O-methyltransferase